MDWMKFFEQESEAVQRTNKIAVKVVFWINSIALTIWTAEQFDYKLYPMPLSFETILKIFSEQYLVLGLMLYFITNFVIRGATGIISSLLSIRIVKRHIKKNKSPFLFTGLKKGLKELKQSGLETEDKTTLSFTNATEALFSVALVYDLIIRLKFGNVHFIIISIIIWSVNLLFIYLRSLISAINELEAREKRLQLKLQNSLTQPTQETEKM